MIYYKKRIEHYKINMLLKKNLDIQLGKAETRDFHRVTSLLLLHLRKRYSSVTTHTQLFFFLKKNKTHFLTNLKFCSPFPTRLCLTTNLLNYLEFSDAHEKNTRPHMHILKIFVFEDCLATQCVGFFSLVYE